MTRTTFPEVPPGRDITDEAARAAALLVRDWYEQSEQGAIETDSIVTVVRWAIHRLASKAVEPRLTEIVQMLAELRWASSDAGAAGYRELRERIKAAHERAVALASLTPSAPQAVEPRLTDEQIDRLLAAINDIGMDSDPCAFGLPMGQHEPMEKMRAAVRASLTPSVGGDQGIESPPPEGEPQP